MNPSLASMLIDQELARFSEFAELATLWSAEFQQLSREQFSTMMQQARVADLLFSNARLGCHVEQKGTTPERMRTFALTASNSIEMHWYGHRVETDCLLLFPSHREISVFSRPGLAVQTLSVPVDVLERRLRSFDPRLVIPEEERVYPLSAGHAAALRRILAAVPEVISAAADITTVIMEFREQVLEGLLGAVASSSGSASTVSARHGRALRLATDFAHAHSRDPLRVSDLVSVAGVSERSLLYLFKREIGLTPKAFLNGRRLYGAHKALTHAEDSEARVREIASHWGYWHMGQFAADYRKMFGELPRDTLMRK